MLEFVEVITHQGTMLKLPLRDVSEGFIVTNIEGLDPGKATMVSSNFATMDGARYQASRREARNVVMRLALEPDYATGSVSALRQRLYLFLMPKSEVKLSFVMEGGARYNITARVESFETALFSKEPSVDISMLCFDPDFYNPAKVMIGGLSTSAGDDESPVMYSGTVETGFYMTLVISASVDRFSVTNRAPDNTVRSLDFVSPLFPDTYIDISTVPGEKGVWRYETEAMLYAISPYSDWLKLYPGINNIRVETDIGSAGWMMTWTDKHGGL